MRIHTDTLTDSDLFDAGRAAGVLWDGSRYSRKGSRSRNHAFDVSLRGSSNRYPMGGNDGSGKAATWDEWGIFLAYLFNIDPNARVAGVYEDAKMFDYKTFGRFSDGVPSDVHGDHKWDYAAPYAQACSKCTAKSRHK